jgi:2-polyprenyl-3-methyl-5-hydroxy-6-metoxy-1,4-benzoquinol methylase
MILNTQTNCLICQSSDIKPLKGYEEVGLTKCRQCGFVFMKQVPSGEELHAHYSKYSYSREPYLSPITVKRYHELLDRFDDYRKTNCLLDVGCGVGFFLREAKSRGWQVFGTEYSDEGVKKCLEKGIEMRHGKLDAGQFPGVTFDVITSFEVIEHINNPAEEMKEISKLLRSGGLFYVTTPNFNSISRNILKQKWNIIGYPEHLSYYTPKTLNRLMKRSGFRSQKILTTGISVTRYKTSKKVSNEKLISSSSSDELLRKRIESKKYLKLAKQVINKLLSLSGKGDNLKGFFIKG